MGVKLVKKAERWKLTGRETRVLVCMARTVKDSDSTPVYWGGWERLAAVLGYEYTVKTWTDRDGIKHEKYVIAEHCRKAAQKQTNRVIKSLIRKGVLVPGAKAYPGRNADYALALDGSRTWVPTLNENGSKVESWVESDRKAAREESHECSPKMLPRNDPRSRSAARAECFPRIGGPNDPPGQGHNAPPQPGGPKEESGRRAGPSSLAFR